MDASWFHRIKSATRDLVTACGGVERSCHIASVSDSEVSRWQVATQNAIIPIGAALALEAECGIPYVTRAMAELNGRGLADPTEGGRPAGDLDTAIMRTASAFSSSMNEYMAARADGVVTPAEADRVDREFGKLEGEIGQARGQLAGHKLQVVGK